MRFSTIRAHKMGVLDDVDLNLDAIPGKLVGVVGPNGSGKTTLLGLLAGAMYREVPTRGSLGSLARARDSFVEVKAVNGSNWTLRHAVDSVSGAGDSIVLREDGSPAFDSAKRRSFDAWASKHLPPPEVTYASIFSAQQAGGFLDMKAAERKQVLLKILGAERLEALAEAARGRGRDAKTAAARLRGRMDSLPSFDMAEVDAELVQATRGVADAEAALAGAKQADEAAKTYAVTLRRLEDVRKSLGDLEGRRANNAALLPEADKIRQAAARTVELREKLVPAVDAEIAAITAQISTIDGQRRETVARWEAAQRHATDARSRIAAADRVLAGESEVTRATESLQGLRDAVQQTADEEAAAKVCVDELANSLLDGAGKRIGALRAGLTQIATEAGNGIEQRAVATRVLAEDDAAKVEIETGPTRLATARAQLADGAQLLRKRRDDLAHAERIAARAGEFDAARAAKATAAEQLATAEHEATQYEEMKADLEPQKKELADLLAEKNFVRAGYSTEIGGLAVDARRAPHLENASARLAEIDPQIAKLTAEKAELEAAPAVDAETDHLAQAETRLSACRARRERAALAVEQAKKTTVDRANVEAELEATERSVSAAVVLAESLGKDGLQALEADVAAVQLTQMANDLLQNCVSTRWTISIETTRASADGKRELETCDVRVVDTERGRDALVETLSGGERVLIGEAISLAITMFVCQRNGISGATLIRDESGAALDAANSRAYVAMLRRAAELANVHQLLLVSHSPEVQALCDSRIVVADGRVSVEA
ncbi:MAG: ATP-binding cassette domain-containing protein [Polyangiaceae bacterium]|nr:ATP-binding cassette domain-containing protein [Polyangiaceae bacterium]